VNVPALYSPEEARRPHVGTVKTGCDDAAGERMASPIRERRGRGNEGSEPLRS
jgi:hypothetical protein